MGNISEKEKRLLVVVVIFAAVVVGVVLGGERFVGGYTSEQRAIFTDLESQIADYRTRLSQIQDEERLQNQYVESYIAYKESGLIIGEDLGLDTQAAAEADEATRLDLLERLQQIQQDRKFFPVETRLTKPENLPSTFSEYTADSDVSVRTNLMTVSMPMLHGLDILMLLGDFYDRSANAFTPVRCRLKKGDEPVGESEVANKLLEIRENIAAECDLVWLTVYDPLQGKATGTAS